MQPGEISSSERMWAALAHSALLINLLYPGPPIVITMAIWVFKRKSSNYVGFQALQAFIFQALMVFLALMIQMVSGPGFLLILLLAVLYAMYGAFRCNQGREFRYLFIGDFLTSIMTKDK